MANYFYCNNDFRYKLVVAEAVVGYLKPIQENISRYMQNPDYLTDILRQGNEKAQEIASNTWEELQYKMGFKVSLEMNSKIEINK